MLVRQERVDRLGKKLIHASKSLFQKKRYNRVNSGFSVNRDSVNLSAEEDDEAEDTEEKTEDDDLFEILAGKHRFQDCGKILHIGIIDYLTQYNFAKKVERWGKTLNAEQSTVSVAPPEFYGDRF